MKKTAWICVLLVIVVAVCLVSCSQADDKDELKEFESLLEELEDEDTESVAAGPFADRVYIIIPKEASAELKERAVALSDNIHSKTEVEAMVKYDYEDIEAHHDDLLIFVGKVDSMPSKEAVALLRKGEYLCKWVKQDIVLAARDDEAAVAAVDEFIKTIIPGASNAAIMSAEAHFEHKVDYDISSITVNGYDLYDFSFVCHGETFEKVNVFNKYIVEKSGYLIDIFCEDKVEGKKISFAFDSGISGAVIERAGQDIKVRADGEYALSVAIAKLADLIFGDISDGVASLEISRSYEMALLKKELRICSAYYLNDGVPRMEQITKFSDSIHMKAFDLILIGDLSRESFDDISLNIPDEYRIIHSASGNGKIFCALYMKNTFDRIGCKFDQGLFVVDALVSGEDVSRRVIMANGADPESLGGVVNVGEEHNIVLLSSTPTEKLCKALNMKVLGEHSWRFGEQPFVCGFISEYALKNKSDEIEVVKEAGNGYMNLFIYADIFVEYCADFEKLKNAVN